jgi:tRNA threonylcarbamoyladenosine biosynthesis protein TsaE
MRSMQFVKILKDESDTLRAGADLAVSSGDTAIIYLYGELGAGKTSLARGFLQGLEYQDKVKSPTYTLVEPYFIKHYNVYHFDLYRLNDPQELEFIGVQDYFVPPSICLIEWPEHGKSILPPADLACYLETLPEGRELRMEALTPRGKAILKKMVNLQG